VQTHGRPFFVGFNYLRSDAPIIHLAPTTEIEYPWRVCPKSLVIKLPKGRGMVMGKWKFNVRPWEETLLEILKGREIYFAEEEGQGNTAKQSLEYTGISESA
jgi:hypothetical protein